MLCKNGNVNKLLLLLLLLLEWDIDLEQTDNWSECNALHSACVKSILYEL